MKRLVIVCILCIGTLGYAQPTVSKIQEEINSVVWKPFQKAFETLDGNALNATYAANVLRVTPNGIDTKNAFKAANLERFKQNRTDGISIALDFWFDSRKTNETTSYEVGFYRITATTKEGVKSANYGQFHIVLKKIGGSWKITQDWDTTTINGKFITAADFTTQKPLKF